MTVLDVEHIEKHFGATRVLEDISFSMEQGKSLAIIGSSGSGKTTLLRCLNFLETPDKGRILVNGQLLFDASDPATQREGEVRRKRLHFGLVFQSFNLFPQYTALENVTLASRLLARERADFKAKRREILEEIDTQGRALLERMGLADRAGHYPHQLSGGQQQRVAIARALALHPDILCFDEPTSALDPELTGEVLKVIRSLAEQNTTMIIVTHEMAFARDVADQVIFMDQGVIVEQGSAQQVIEHPREERTRQFLARYAENGKRTENVVSWHSCDTAFFRPPPGDGGGVREDGGAFFACAVPLSKRERLDGERRAAALPGCARGGAVRPGVGGTLVPAAQPGGRNGRFSPGGAGAGEAGRLADCLAGQDGGATPEDPGADYPGQRRAVGGAGRRGGGSGKALLKMYGLISQKALTICKASRTI